jgi:hypothetical protein
MKILITLGLAAVCSLQGTALGAKPKLRQIATGLEFFHG